MRKAWRVFVTIVQCPVRHPLCAVAWFIGGGLFYDFSMKAVWDPDSTSAWCDRHLGPFMGIAFLVLVPGIIGGPWCLLYQFLTGKLFGGKGTGTK